MIVSWHTGWTQEEQKFKFIPDYIVSIQGHLRIINTLSKQHLKKETSETFLFVYFNQNNVTAIL